MISRKRLIFESTSKYFLDKVSITTELVLSRIYIPSISRSIIDLSIFKPVVLIFFYNKKVIIQSFSYINPRLRYNFIFYIMFEILILFFQK